MEEIRDKRGIERRMGDERGQGREGGEVTRGEKRRGKGRRCKKYKVSTKPSLASLQ